ncbi:hypothetical protein B296_00013671, partial [Ensete ventricosum]
DQERLIDPFGRWKRASERDGKRRQSHGRAARLLRRQRSSIRTITSFRAPKISPFSSKLDILRETFLMVLAENAFGADGHLKQPKELSINKVGHGLSSSCHAIYFLFSSSSAALHEIDPVFKEFSFSDKISGMLCSLGYKRPVVIQSMYIFKVPS